MAEKEAHRVETLSEFIEWAAQFNDEKYLFRGVPNDCYKIEASACRRLPKVERENPDRLLRINKRLIEEAKAQGHDQKNGQRLYDLELLAELQHFGAATCLIDFSRNALVALWFACQQNSEEKQKNGKVFAVRSDDPARFKTVTPDLAEKKIDHFFERAENGYPLYQWEPKLQNNRIIAQHSVFVFGGVQVEAEDECVIIQSSKQAILKSLNQLSDITEASMYPDFDGFARLHAHDKPYTEPDAQGYLRRGVEAHQRQDLDNAIAYYTRVIELDPAEISIVAEAYNNRGLVYSHKGEYDCAIKDFDKAIELKSDYAGAFNNRGVNYRHKSKYGCAIKDFDKAIELKPDYADAYYNRALVYYKKSEARRTIDDCSKAIQLYAGGDADSVVRHSRNMTALRTEEWIPAAKNPFVHYNRGIAWLCKHGWKEARLDLTYAKDMGVALAVAFCDDYGSVEDFQRELGKNLPEDITEMLTST